MVWWSEVENWGIVRGCAKHELIMIAWKSQGDSLGSKSRAMQICNSWYAVFILCIFSCPRIRVLYKAVFSADVGCGCSQLSNDPIICRMKAELARDLDAKWQFQMLGAADRLKLIIEWHQNRKTQATERKRTKMSTLLEQLPSWWWERPHR